MTRRKTKGRIKLATRHLQPHYKAHCKGKRQYQTEALAEPGRLFVQHRYRRPASTYLCLYCGFYHVGRTPKTIRMHWESKDLYYTRRKLVHWLRGYMGRLDVAGASTTQAPSRSMSPELPGGSSEPSRRHG